MSEKEKSEQKKFKSELCFSTPIWVRQLTEHQRINTNLVEISHILEIEEQGKGVIHSNVGGWHSDTLLHQRKDMAEITKAIASACAASAKELNFDFVGFELSITDMWLNRNGPGDLNKPHVHPHAILSGVYYVQIPADSGNFEFFDPVAARVSTQYPVSAKKPGYAPSVEITPVEGGLVIFPSWLQHWVQPNRGTGDRVSISFNVGYQARNRTSKAP